MHSKNVRRAIAGGRALLLQPERRFWLIVGLITLGGAALRVLVHDFGLPWFEEVDELRLWFYGRQVRGLPVPGARTFESLYPPLILWLHQMVQPLAEAQGRPLAMHAVLDLRRVMLLFTIPGTIWFAMLGRRCGGALAGIIAAALWAFEPNVIETMIYAIAESIVIPLLFLSLLLAIQALDTTRRRSLPLTLTSIALGVLCFLGEYRLLVAIFPGLVALAWHLWRRFRPGWRYVLLWSIVGVTVAGSAGALLWMRLPERIRGIAGATLTTYLWDIDGLFVFLGRSIGLLHPLTLPLALLLLLLVLRSRHETATAPVSVPALLLVTSTLILVSWAAGSIRPYGDSLQRVWLRNLLPILLCLYLLMATSVAQILSAVKRSPVRRLVQVLLCAHALLFLFLPGLRLALDYRIPSWPVVVRDWLDSNLEASTILIYNHSEDWLDPLANGMPLRTGFDWREVGDIRDYSLDELINEHRITWALVPAIVHQKLINDEQGQAMLEQMLLVREFTAPPVRRDYETLLYRLWRMQQESDVRFGEHVRLVGHDLHTPHAGPGDEPAFTLYWNAPATPPADFMLFLHLVSAADERPLARVEGRPAMPGRPTRTWNQPGETLISPRFTLTLPPDLAPGDYRVLLGLYDVETGARLPVRDAQGISVGDALELTHYNVAVQDNEREAPRGYG